MTAIATAFIKVKADTAGIAGEIEQGAAKPVEKAGRRLSERFGGKNGFGNKAVLDAIGAAAGEIIGTAVGRGAGAVLNGSAADSLGRFSTNLGSLSGGLAALGIGAGALTTVAAAADGLSGASDLLASSTGVLSAAKGIFVATTDAETGAVTASGLARAKDLAITLAHTAAEKAAAVASKVFAAGQWLLNAALTANPIGLVVVGVAALVAGFILAYKKSETFRNIVKTLWDWLKKFIGFTPLGALIENFDKVKQAVGYVVDKIKDLIGWIGKIPTPHISLPHIPGFANGGVLGPGLSIVGERGPELIRSARGGERVYSHPLSAQILNNRWGVEDIESRNERSFHRSLDVNPRARLDTSQILDYRYGRPGPSVRDRLASVAHIPQKTAVVVHGGITVVAHKTEDSGEAIARGLRNLSHRLGF